MTKSIPLFRAAAQVVAVLGFCLLAFACPAFAFTPPAKSGGENTPLNLSSSSAGSHTTSTGGASLVRTIVGLAIVIAVIWGLAWILRQVKAGREGGRDSDQTAGLASVATLTLGSGRSVHLVRAGSEYVLLGSAEHGLVPISRYTEQQAREAGLLTDTPAPRSRRSLLAAAGILRPVRPGGEEAGPASPAVRYASPAIDNPSLVIEDASPVVRDARGRVDRPDPMQMPSPAVDLVGRLREWTVRR
jgi:flagellar protein FliO/FliZ